MIRFRNVARVASLVLAAGFALSCAHAQSRSRDRYEDRYDRNDRYDDRRREADRWTWSGSIEAGRWLYVRNMNGAIRVEPSSGSTVEVTAVKYEHRYGRASDVRITAEQRAGRGDAVICARWNDRTECDEDRYSTSNSRGLWDWRDNDRNDVEVEFTVRLPRGVRVTATTINGSVDIDGAESEVVARTVNGGVTARSNGGPVSARTVNGSLTIRTGAIGTGPLDYSTTNGQITVEVPANTNADVDLHTVNGEIVSDFPLTIEGRFNTRRLRGTIGRGGSMLRLSTTNGSIHLRKVS
jgi:hypothetical protein